MRISNHIRADVGVIGDLSGVEGPGNKYELVIVAVISNEIGKSDNVPG
jgi:hypothetical protein